MKIKDNTKKYIRFDDLKIGDVFAYGDGYFLKISSDSIFDLETNEILGFHDEDYGRLLNVELIINN